MIYEPGLTTKKEAEKIRVDKSKYPAIFEIFSKINDAINEGNKPVDALVALGHNWSKLKQDWNPEEPHSVVLSLPSKITAISAYLLLRLGFTNNIIFSTGKTAGPNQPAEASEMKKYILRLLSIAPGTEIYKDISNKIILEESSYDTYTNALESQKIIDEKNFNDAALMSIGYHMNLRARNIFNAVGIKQIKLNVSSDSILRELIEYINTNLNFITQYDPSFAEEFLKIRFELRLLICEYEKFLKSPITIDNGKPGLRAHGPEYHLLVRIFQEITRDPKSEKLSERARKMRFQDMESLEG